MSVSIQNAGLGPMLIQKIVLVRKQDEPIQAGIALAEVLPLDLNCDVFVYNKDVYALASLNEMKLFQYSSDTHDNDTMTLLKNKLNCYFLCIEYTDIYDHNYVKKEALTL